ncbi:MAG: porin family protein [Burkholderiales bacterium]|nr:porin family protein [Burkholderiales bacterium]
MNASAWAASLAAGLAAGSASAQWYAGAGLGVAGAAIDGSAGAIGLSARDKRNTSFKLVGGYQFTPHWGVEAQFTDLGRAGYNACVGATCGAGSVGLRQWSVTGTGTYTLANNYFVFGKLGVTWNQARGDAFCAAGACGGSPAGTRSDLLAGLGVGYQFSRNISMRLEYEHFGRAVSGNGFSAKADNWSASLRYTF